MLVLLGSILGVLCALATLPGTLDLLLLTVAALLRPRRLVLAPGVDPDALRLAVVVPAHDEEANVARTVHSLLACDGAERGGAVVVVADNCTDGTAAAAAAAGARVLVRDDPVHRGKGFALDFAFRALAHEGFNVFAVVDADTIVEPGFVGALRRAFAAGAGAAQVRYLRLGAEQSLRARLLNVAFAGFNVVRPRGRDRLGLSAGIAGNGFALSRATLAAVPYAARSIVEDLEYRLRLVRAGRRVRFIDEVAVRGEMPSRGAGARSQRARWEGGRLLVLRQHLPGLLRDAMRGRWRLLEPAAELMLLPLAFHVLLLLVALAVPFAPARVYAAAALGVVALHVLVAARLGGGGLRDLAALAAAPGYVLWKLLMLPRIARAARRDAEWVRTARTEDGGTHVMEREARQRRKLRKPRRPREPREPREPRDPVAVE